MATSKDDLRRWLEEGAAKQATHMIVVVDTFDYVDFPVYVMPGEDAKARAAEELARPMQRVMEVYNLGRSFEEQLNEHRAFNY